MHCRYCALLALVTGSAVVSAQNLLPSTPPKGFGASVTPAFEGWFDNPDGAVTIAEPRAKMSTIKGGKPDEPFSGKASTTVTFDEPGDYVLHVTANDYSGNGGGGAACCWTTAMVKVSVKGEGPRTTGAR